MNFLLPDGDQRQNVCLSFCHFGGLCRRKVKERTGGGGGGRKRKKRSSKLALHNARVTHGASLGLSKGGTGPGLMAKTGCPSPSYEYGGTVISIVIGRLLHTQICG